MALWESRFGRLLCVLLLAGVGVVALTGVRVHQATHPERERQDGFDFDSLLLAVDEVRFPAVDGIELSGWLLEGDAAFPPILLCHDLGSSKTSLVYQAIDLNGRGYPVLLFDFRGHGHSRGRGSTLGLEEKRDILGALEFLTDHAGREPPRVGIYAVGMGAHAAVLAAADRPSLRVLVLDGLYPDASFPLARSVFAGWSPAVRYLAFMSDGMFAVMSRARIGDHRAAEALPNLLGRDLLLLAPEGDRELVAAMQRMVSTVPDQPDVDGNLIVLPATHAGGLYGADLERHRQQVARFFDERLGRPSVARLGG